MTDGQPLVSVIVPARDEADDLAPCLEAILQQDWPAGALEVLVVDGASSDATAAVARSTLDDRGLARWEVLSNGRATTPSNLNTGLAAAGGAYLCRVDTRSVIPPDYVATCVDVLATRPDVVVVGGSQQAQARAGAGAVARGIARALRNPYVTGFARYRRRGASGPGDTVYLGAFRTDEVRAAGGWDERFLTNQDYELNRRLGDRGVVWYEAALVVAYRPRATLGALAAQHRRFGRWKAAAWLEGGVGVHPRQVALLAAPPVALAGGLWLLARWPVGALGLAVAGAVALDATMREPAPLPERAGGVVASAIIAGSWWSGAAEQLVRSAFGQRLLGR